MRYEKTLADTTQNEEQYDVLICYEKPSENEIQTYEQEEVTKIYNLLTIKGFKVFLSFLTLKSIPEEEHEFYTFSTLKNTKALIVFGTRKHDFFKESLKDIWEGFIVTDINNKKRIISVYSNMRIDELPRQFFRLYALNTNDENFPTDLVRNVERIIYSKEKEIKRYPPTITDLLNNAKNNLNNNWTTAKYYCRKVHELDPENPDAYLYLFFSELKVRNEKEIKDKVHQCACPFDNIDIYKKAIKIIDEDIAERLVRYNERIKRQKEQICNTYFLIKQQREEIEKSYNKVCKEYKSSAIISEVEEKIKVKKNEITKHQLTISSSISGSKVIKSILAIIFVPILIIFLTPSMFIMIMLYSVLEGRFLLIFEIIASIFDYFCDKINIIKSYFKEDGHKVKNARVRLTHCSNELTLLEQQLQQYKDKNNKIDTLEKQLNESKEQEKKEYEEMQQLIKTKYPWRS